MMKKNILIIIITGFVLSQCTDRYISRDELKAYPLNVKNGVIKSIDKSGIQIDAYYRSKDLIIAQELTPPVADTDLNKIESQYDSLDYFILRLSKNGKEIENGFVSNSERFSNVVSYLSSSLAERVYLVLDRDTIPALDAMYARTFGATTATQVMLIFKSNLVHQDGNVKLVYDDNFFGTGLNEFQFDVKNIKRIPRLNFHTL
jgi:hypothetical protein